MYFLWQPSEWKTLTGKGEKIQFLLTQKPFFHLLGETRHQFIVDRGEVSPVATWKHGMLERECRGRRALVQSDVSLEEGRSGAGSCLGHCRHWSEMLTSPWQHVQLQKVQCWLCLGRKRLASFLAARPASVVEFGHTAFRAAAAPVPGN